MLHSFSVLTPRGTSFHVFSDAQAGPSSSGAMTSSLNKQSLDLRGSGRLQPKRTKPSSGGSNARFAVLSDDHDKENHRSNADTAAVGPGKPTKKVLGQKPAGGANLASTRQTATRNCKPKTTCFEDPKPKTDHMPSLWQGKQPFAPASPGLDDFQLTCSVNTGSKGKQRSIYDLPSVAPMQDVHPGYTCESNNSARPNIGAVRVSRPNKARQPSALQKSCGATFAIYQDVQQPHLIGPPLSGPQNAEFFTAARYLPAATVATPDTDRLARQLTESPLADVTRAYTGNGGFSIARAVTDSPSSSSSGSPGLVVRRGARLVGSALNALGKSGLSCESLDSPIPVSMRLAIAMPDRGLS